MRHGGFRLDLGGTADGNHSPDSDIPRLLSFYSNVRARIARFAVLQLAMPSLLSSVFDSITGLQYLLPLHSSIELAFRLIHVPRAHCAV